MKNSMIFVRSGALSAIAMLGLCSPSHAGLPVQPTDAGSAVTVRLTPAAPASHGVFPREEMFVRDVYARLMRYDAAGRATRATDDRVTSPGNGPEGLVVSVANVVTRMGVPEGIALERRGSLGSLEIQRRWLCEQDAPCHLYYDVTWMASRQVSPVSSAAPDRDEVERYTTYRVTVSAGDLAVTYDGMVLFHPMRGRRGTAVPQMLDPVVANIEDVVSDRQPVAHSPWMKYIRMPQFHALKKMELGRPRKWTIGYVPGDEAGSETGDVALLAMAGEPCATPDCQGRPNDTPCTDGPSACDVDKCTNGNCNHTAYSIDPCPGVYGWDTSHVTSATLDALACLEDLVAELGGTVLTHESAWRPQSYQDHLVKVANAATALSNWNESECSAVREWALHEKVYVHGLGNTVAPVSHHTDGTAFDVTVSVPNVTVLSTRARMECGLSRIVAGEPWHWHYIGVPDRGDPYEH